MTIRIFKFMLELILVHTTKIHGCEQHACARHLFASLEKNALISAYPLPAVLRSGSQTRSKFTSETASRAP